MVGGAGDGLAGVVEGELGDVEPAEVETTGAGDLDEPGRAWRGYIHWPRTVTLFRISHG